MKITDIKVGDEYFTSNGERYIIKKMYGEGQNARCLVEFTETGNYQIVFPPMINSNKLKDSSKTLLYGVGYIKGTEENPSLKSGENTDVYAIWSGMLRRCYYNGEGINKYKLVQVCEEWFDFMKFKEWYRAHVPKEHPSWFAIDKDLLGRGKRIYCPEYCCMLPIEINACISAIKNIDNPSLTETSAKSVYLLSKLIEKYKGLIEERAEIAIRGFVKAYEENYKRVMKETLESHYKHLELQKTDLKKVKLTAFIEYNGEIKKLVNGQELKLFVREIEEEELFRQKSKLI